MFAEGWRQKVEQNAPFELLQAAKTGTYVNPLVTVALRSDGSVESVVINRSSGVPAIDNAVRQIVLMLSPYEPIPRDLALDYDVVEIERVWTFDAGLRLVYGRR
jgi:TonB family protein